MYWMISRHLEQRFTVISPGAVSQLLARKVSLILSQLNSFSVTSTCLAFFLYYTEESNIKLLGRNMQRVGLQLH